MKSSFWDVGPDSIKRSSFTGCKKLNRSLAQQRIELSEHSMQDKCSACLPEESVTLAVGDSPESSPGATRTCAAVGPTAHHPHSQLISSHQRNLLQIDGIVVESLVPRKPAVDDIT
jgi:hypothetical protein